MQILHASGLFALLLGALLACASTPAQTPTVTAAVVHAPLSVTVSNVFTGNQTQNFPVGPLTSANLSTQSSFGGSAALSAATLAGVNHGRLTFGATGQSTTSAAFWISGEIVFTVATATPAPVRIVLSGTYNTPIGHGYAAATTAIDIDNNGGVDLYLPPLAPVSAEFYRATGPGGVQVRVRHFGAGNSGGFGQWYAVNLTIDCYVDEYEVTSEGQGCTNLGYVRPSPGVLDFECPAAAGSLVYFVVGFQAMNATVPLYPFCPQFTDIVFLRPVLPVQGVASYRIPPFSLLPPGFTVRTQAAVITPGLDLLTTNCLVMTGP